MRSPRENTCHICGKVIGASSGDLCDSFECSRRAAIARKKRDQQDLYQQQLRLATVERDNALGDCSSDDKADWWPIVTPANTRKLTPLPRRRKYRFVNRLRKLIAENAHHDVDDDQTVVRQAADVLPILGSACANCRGSCCQRGGTAAYIDRRVVKRYLAKNPSASPRDLIEAYCQYLPAESYRGSCVYHSAIGCALPREMRSNSCNNTVCDGFAELRNRVVHDGQDKFFLAAMDALRVVRTRVARG